MGNEAEDKELELLGDHCSQLREWFDSVLILATRVADDGEDTTVWYKGLGNQFASLGAVYRYMAEKEAEAANTVIEISMDDEEDEEE